jgi:hypothetical protein
VIFHVRYEGVVSSGREEAPQIDDLLDINVVVLRFRQDEHLIAKSDVELPVVALIYRARGFEQ